MSAGGGDFMRKLTLNDIRDSLEDHYEQLVDVVTIDRKKGKAVIIKPEVPLIERKTTKGNRISPVDRDKRNAQIEAIIEIITHARAQFLKPKANSCEKQEYILNKDVVQGEFENVGRVLGKGNSCGEVFVVRDKVTQRDAAYKTVMVSQFSGDEIRAWVSLADENMAPDLFLFKLENNKVSFVMEVLEGRTLQDIIDNWGNVAQKGSGDGSGIRMEDLAICILDDLLKMNDQLRQGGYIHGDMHAGNVILEDSMQVKLLDFGRARQLLTLDGDMKTRNIENDIVGIIRIFCAIYSGVDFNDVFEAKTQLKENTEEHQWTLTELSKNMCGIPEESRKELFKIMSMLFDCVRDPRQENYGETGKVASHIRLLQPKDIIDFKKRAAVILFPEKYQVKREDMYRYECETDGGDIDSVLYSLEMDDFLRNVTLKDLQELERLKLF